MNRTLFAVTVDGTEYAVAVQHKLYEATAIVMVECLKHFRCLTHKEAVRLYTDSLKTVSRDALSIEGVMVKFHQDQFHDYDVLLTDVPTPSPAVIQEYWTY